MSESTMTAENTQQQKTAETPRSVEESMIVRLSRLDRLLELAGEVIIVSSNLNALGRQIRDGMEVSRTMSEDIKDLAITSSRISSDLHNLVSDVRTVDMQDLFARFKRLARDTSRRLGKAIRFEVEGEDINIDKKLSEKIYDPIAHQIRNAMDHGIEDEQTRKAKGKDPVGTVKVRVRNLETSTIIDVIDDGKGIDAQSVRDRIIQTNLLDAKSAASLSEDALYEYLFAPGFSTASQTSSTSGRGVGLDVVRTIMTEIGGETRISSQPDKGTTFSFILPVVTAVNISDALLVRAGTMHFAFPILSVVATQSITPKDITTTTGRGKSILYLGNILPMFDLMEVFGEPPVESENDEIRIIIVEHKNRRLAYVVSDFLNPQKIVISEFGDGMKVPGLLGTAVLSGRQMAMVVDLPRLVDQTVGTQKEISISASIGKTPAETVIPLAIEETAKSQKPQESIKPPEQDTAPNVSQTPPPAEQPDSAFLQEVESMLNKLNRELLNLDEQRDKETADSVFRLMHSIKGNLTMCGLEESAEIAHRLETILEQARKDQLKLEDEVFDALFDGESFLEDVVSTFQKGGKLPSPPDKLKSELKNYEKSEPAETQKPDTDILNAQVSLDPTGQFYLSSRRREGANLFQCRLKFEPGDQPDFLVAYLILRRIQNIADVLGTLPAMTDISSGICENEIAVIFAPREPREDLIEKLGQNLKRYYGVTHFDCTSFV